MSYALESASLEGPDIAASSKHYVVTPRSACCQTSALYYRTDAASCLVGVVVRSLQAVLSALDASLCDSELLSMPEAMGLVSRIFPTPEPQAE
jgi:hypothetical protein